MEMSAKQREVYDTASEVLVTLLEMMDIPAMVSCADEFTAEEEEGTTASIGLNIEGEDLGLLIGRRGQTLASLQHIVRLIVSARLQIRIPIVLDVEGYKSRRCEGLRLLAARLAEQVRTSRAPFALEPMPPFERRIIHLSLADDPDVTTESAGVGDARKVVILPKGQHPY